MERARAIVGILLYVSLSQLVSQLVGAFTFFKLIIGNFKTTEGAVILHGSCMYHKVKLNQILNPILTQPELTQP